MSLITLPDEIIQSILLCLRIRDIFALRIAYYDSQRAIQSFIVNIDIIDDYESYISQLLQVKATIWDILPSTKEDYIRIVIGVHSTEAIKVVDRHKSYLNGIRYKVDVYKLVYTIEGSKSNYDPSYICVLDGEAKHIILTFGYTRKNVEVYSAPEYINIIDMIIIHTECSKSRIYGSVCAPYNMQYNDALVDRMLLFSRYYTNIYHMIEKWSNLEFLVGLPY